MRERKKYLFITHTVAPYGAFNSLKLLLKNLTGIDMYLIVPSKVLKYRKNKDYYNSLFGVNFKEVKSFYLPWSNCYIGKNNSLIVLLKLAVKKLLYKLNKNKLDSYLDEEKFSVIHLNSLVLYTLITNRYNFLLHIRELFDYTCNIEYVKSKIGEAKGFIAIDIVTYSPFKELVNGTIINNPFDMSNIKFLDDNKLELGNYALINKHKDNIVISMIGAITKEKGVPFVIKSFMESNKKDILLVIVGSGDKSDMKYCRKLANGNNFIQFLGEVKKIEEVYYISDYVIRGESVPRIGRTMYEGLYAGCSIIVPGSLVDYDKELENFSDKIVFYKPRDSKDLTTVIKSLDKKIAKQFIGGNITDYIDKFNKFIYKKFNI